MRAAQSHHFLCTLLLPQTWSLLYGLMGYASYLVWQQTGWPSQPLTVYAVQLALNLAWQVMFFLGHKPKAALVENTGEAGWGCSMQLDGSMAATWGGWQLLYWCCR